MDGPPKKVTLTVDFSDPVSLAKLQELLSSAQKMKETQQPDSMQIADADSVCQLFKNCSMKPNERGIFKCTKCEQCTCNILNVGKLSPAQFAAIKVFDWFNKMLPYGHTMLKARPDPLTLLIQPSTFREEHAKFFDKVFNEKDTVYRFPNAEGVIYVRGGEPVNGGEGADEVYKSAAFRAKQVMSPFIRCKLDKTNTCVRCVRDHQHCPFKMIGYTELISYLDGVVSFTGDDARHFGYSKDIMSIMKLQFSMAAILNEQLDASHQMRYTLTAAKRVRSPESEVYHVDTSSVKTPSSNQGRRRMRDTPSEPCKPQHPPAELVNFVKLINDGFELGKQAQKIIPPLFDAAVGTATTALGDMMNGVAKECIENMMSKANEEKVEVKDDTTTECYSTNTSK